ncbi:hypothetical protein LTR49_024917 [Elasticomyces elasticus]|nr:hypothetical protein LTR49_024917 [Elasticomyces elasticus]
MSSNRYSSLPPVLLRTLPDNDTFPGRRNVHLLRHFHKVTSLSLGSSLVQEAMHSNVAQTAWSQAYLMHIVLAVASVDFKCHTSSTNQARQYLTLAVMGARHWQTGRELYRGIFATSEGIRQQRGDVVIGITFLAAIYTFALGEPIEPDAYFVAYDEAVSHAISPMAAASGIPAMRYSLRLFDNSSAWKAVIEDSDDGQGTFTSEDQGIAGLPPAFVDLCGLDSASTAQNNRYHVILRHLGPLLRSKPTDEHFVKCIAFGARTFLEFRLLLEQKDPKALLLISYWFALLGQLDQWWSRARVKSECLAITDYLSTVPDTRIHALLFYPASFGQATTSWLWLSLATRISIRINHSNAGQEHKRCVPVCCCE